MSPGVVLPTLDQGPAQDQNGMLGNLQQPMGDASIGMHKVEDVTTPPMGSPQHAETPGAPQEVSPSERAAQHRLAVSAAVGGGAVGLAGTVDSLPAAANSIGSGGVGVVGGGGGGGAGSADLSGGQLGKRKRLDSSSKSLLVPSPLQHSTDAEEAARAMKFPRAEESLMAPGTAGAAVAAPTSTPTPAVPHIPQDGLGSAIGDVGAALGLGLELGGGGGGGGAPAVVPAPMTIPEFVPTMSSRAVNASKQKKAEAAAAAEASAAAAVTTVAAPPQSAQALAAYNNSRAATRSVYDQETTYDQHNRKIYQCRTCSRTFTHPPAFAQHKRSHEREAGGYNAAAVHHHQPPPQRERTHHQRGSAGSAAGHRTASAGSYAGSAAEWDVAGIADTRVHDDGVREWLVDWTHKYGNKHRQRSWEMLWAFVSLQGVNAFLLDFEYKRTGINNDVDALVKFCKSHGVL